MQTKRKILFVGSFKEKAKDGSVGGQMYACKSLINSDLSNHVDWILFDITGKPILFLGCGQEYSDLEQFDKNKFLEKLGL